MVEDFPRNYSDCKPYEDSANIAPKETNKGGKKDWKFDSRQVKKSQKNKKRIWKFKKEKSNFYSKKEK